jgi:predicted permease
VIQVVVDVLLPIFLVAGIGVVARRRLQVSVDALNHLVFYILGPCLVFTSLTQVDFRSPEPGQIALFASAATAVMITIGLAVSRLAGMDRVLTRAFLLAVTFPNLGNYGVSVALLAYGQVGLTAAVILFSAQTVFAQIVATVVASSGSGSLANALLGVIRLPVTIAVVAALAFDVTDIAVPAAILTAIDFPARAAIPMMLLLLGMNLDAPDVGERRWNLALAVGVRLLGGLAVGWVLTSLLGVTGVTRNVLIIGAGMPTAVFTTVIASRYATHPRFVSDAVAISTVASIVTVGATLALLGPT